MGNYSRTSLSAVNKTEVVGRDIVVGPLTLKDGKVALWKIEVLKSCQNESLICDRKTQGTESKSHLSYDLEYCMGVKVGEAFKGTQRNVDDTRKISTEGIAMTKL